MGRDGAAFQIKRLQDQKKGLEERVQELQQLAFYTEHMPTSDLKALKRNMVKLQQQIKRLEISIEKKRE